MLAHYAGAAWTIQQPSGPHVRARCGSSHSAVYAVGDNGSVQHYDGASWTPVALGVTSNGLQSVWGSGPGDVYAVGYQNTLIHLTGGTWTKLDPGSFYYDINGV